MPIRDDSLQGHYNHYKRPGWMGRTAMESRVSIPIAVFVAMALKDKIHRMLGMAKLTAAEEAA